MNCRRILAAATCLLAASVAFPARAQVASTQPPPPGGKVWMFNITPYFWLATIRGNLNFTTPQGDTVTDHISAGINDYLSHLNFAAMVGAEARYSRFALTTDGLFTSLSLTGNVSHLTSVNLRTGGTIEIPREQQLHLGSRTNMGVWTLAGAYTVATGTWGNVDVLAGMRMFGIGSDLDYTLADDIRLPNGTVGLSRSGSLGLGKDYWDGIGGVRGRFNIPNSRFFVPYWFDVGSGGMPLTWQAYVALGYRTSVADLSIGYRYLDFEQSGDKTVHNMSLGGALLAASFRF
jgi:hypothetical protein